MLVQIDRAHEHASWVHAEWHHPRRTAANAANAEGWLLRPRRHHQHWIRWEIHLPHHRRRHAHATPHTSHASSPGWWCHHHPPLATTAGRVHQERVVRDRGVQSAHRRLLMMIRGQRAISRRHVFFCACVSLFLSASSPQRRLRLLRLLLLPRAMMNTQNDTKRKKQTSKTKARCFEIERAKSNMICMGKRWSHFDLSLSLARLGF